MITKNNIVSGVICGTICVVFMWVYMTFVGMNVVGGEMKDVKNMHMMPDSNMMKNDGVTMDMEDMTMGEMVGMMDGKRGRDLEKEFLVGMVPHHAGAVEMAKIILADKTVSAEIRKFAEQIIAAQETEIKQMNEWLKNY